MKYEIFTFYLSVLSNETDFPGDLEGTFPLGEFHWNRDHFLLLYFLSEKGQKIFLTCFQDKVFLFSKKVSGFLR